MALLCNAAAFYCIVHSIRKTLLKSPKWIHLYVEWTAHGQHSFTSYSLCHEWFFSLTNSNQPCSQCSWCTRVMCEIVWIDIFRVFVAHFRQHRSFFISSFLNYVLVVAVVVIITIYVYTSDSLDALHLQYVQGSFFKNWILFKVHNAQISFRFSFYFSSFLFVGGSFEHNTRLIFEMCFVLNV